MQYSTSRENYLKAIYHLQLQESIVTTNDLANELHTSAASITDMLKKLKEQKLLIYERYKGFKLSSEGRKIAVQIVRKHRLWEYFLVEKLHFGWDEVHEIAEELEHISSKKLIDRLDNYLGYPKSDPHGDPIPDSNGKLEQVKQQVSLIDVPAHVSARVTAITDQSSQMLELLQHRNIRLGTWMEIKRKFPFDNSIELKIKNPSISGTINISEEVAKNIMVRYDKQIV